jgi:aquaporin Z
LSQTLVKLTNRLTPNQKKFVGTFIVVVFASGSVVLDSKMHGVLGISFIAFAPFVGVAVGVYMFGKISMADFNPAVTIGSVIGWFLLSHFIYYFSTYAF